MRFGLVAAFLAAVIGLAGTAKATESWVEVAKDNDNNAFDLDMGSIAANGGVTQSWVRERYAHRKREAQSGKSYSVGLTQRLDDCRSHTYALSYFIIQDDKGAVVASHQTPQAEIHFASPPPGAVAEVLHAKVCEVVARRASLKPLVPGGPQTKGEWTSVGYDANAQLRYFIHLDSMATLQGGLVGVVVRADSAAPRKLADGSVAASAYLAQAFDCTARTTIIAAADTYDDRGALIGTSRDEVKPVAFAPGSVSEAIAKFACDPDRGLLNVGGPRTFTGTGWLGPKGYIITANHVVDGAVKLELAHEGKVVGEAELVVADPANDIAVLRPKFREPGHPAILFAPTPAMMGERVFTLGYPAPDVLGVALKMTSGEVSALAGNDFQSGRSDDARFLQVSIPIHSGNSGGPVIDTQGRAVGIVISKMNKTGDDEVAQNVNYALKIGYVRSLLAELPPIAPSVPLKVQPTLSGLVGELKGSVFLIIATKDGEAAE